MSRPARRPLEVREFLRNLRNPYASLQVDEEVAEASAEHFSVEQQRAQRRLLENPYVPVPIAVTARAASSRLAGAARKHANTCTKSQFQSGCRSIFRRYIPPLEKGQLRAHHRAFILRNESRPPAIRHALLSKLQK